MTLREVLLPGPHDCEERRVVGALGVVDDQLGAVGVDALGRKRLRDADLIAQPLNGGSNAL